MLIVQRNTMYKFLSLFCCVCALYASQMMPLQGLLKNFNLKINRELHVKCSFRLILIVPGQENRSTAHYWKYLKNSLKKMSACKDSPWSGIENRLMLLCAEGSQLIDFLDLELLGLILTFTSQASLS